MTMRYFFKEAKTPLPDGGRWATFNSMVDEPTEEVRKRTDIKLTMTDYVVWDVLFRYAYWKTLCIETEEGKRLQQTGCFASVSVKHICDLRDMRESTVRLSLSHLKNAGLIQIAIPRAKGRATIYRVVHKKPKKTENLDR